MLIQSILADCVIGSDRKQCNVAGTLDSLCDFSLMRGTVAGNAAWHDLAALSYKKAQGARLFVVDSQVLFSTKAAHFSALERTSFAGAARAACRTLAGTACWTLI